MDVSIYQINPDRDKDRLSFMNYDFVQKFQGTPRINSAIYDRVYKTSVEKADLEAIYYTFNQALPKNFRGHSLSVSDIVAISDGHEGQPFFYFCDSVGFKRVDFDPEKALESPLSNVKLLREPEVLREPEYYHLEARLGIGLEVTPQEFEILKRGDAKADELLVDLIQSNRCIMGGDTYFPGPWNEDYLEDDLNFDLPSKPLHPVNSRKPSLDEQIQNSKSRTSDFIPGKEPNRGQEPEH